MDSCFISTSSGHKVSHAPEGFVMKQMFVEHEGDLMISRKHLLTFCTEVVLWRKNSVASTLTFRRGLASLGRFRG
jgi:hypothetical protein